MTAPHLVPLHAVSIRGEDARERGRNRGGALAGAVAQTSRAYAELFGELGIGEVDQREAALASLQALRAWDPEQYAELTGIAEGAGLDLLEVGRTVARTEILTLAPAAPGECSTLAHQADGATVSAQTWDWYDRFSGCWHPQRVEPLGGEQAHAGFSEYGIPGKIGLNAAGVGVHLNILKHRDDAPGGVPVHAVLSRVLTRATSVAEAVEIVRSAATTSSSVVTVVSPDRVAMVEISPVGVSVLDGPGWQAHTNHFLAEDRQEGAMLLDPSSNTADRLDFLEQRSAGRPAPRSAEDLVPLLCSPLEQRGVALLPDETLPAAERLATLVTVRTDPVRRRISVSAGVPQRASQASVTYQL
ncbi:C45 family autoproteolytic acyltransferase/hydolase [Ornithinimicrobium tianjinense]|uniref:Peptidase C45 n=1 Tax=Ornithinimicrobium tianjinense TaxID=1195761 RepID=A0A917BFG1_9MICO|nr:C45 family peptidase [Ornithinimicrobium tianjinense]GGF41040.1 peptidase C45 [Ornithinimicrobium tianjinense]